MKHRPEIDGLRAVALIPVIFFHAGISFFSGGYVGVDVFFVISGYLITSIIIRDIEAGKFSIVGFYERRVRRILPALTLILLVCLPFAYYYLMPKQLEEFSQSLVAVSLFFSNVFFWQNTGYFKIGSEFKPLLHTWSLAVEEQYYLFFPVLLVLLSRFRNRLKVIVLALLFVVSLSLAQIWAGIDPTADFYILPSRLWEILMGSFVALYSLYRKNEGSKKEFPLLIKQVLSAFGLALILISIYAFDENTPFPSLYTIIPTLGTALIILFASGQTLINQFLSNKLFVGIGLISYSGYLWHLPVFVFARIINGKELNIQQILILSLFSLGLAYLSWKYIETPFRDKSRISRKRIFLLAAISSFVMISIGAIGWLGEGFGNRIAPDGRTYAELGDISQVNYGLGKECEQDVINENCKTKDSPEVLVWGDSFAMQLVPGILASNPDAGIMQLTMSVCGPVLDTAIVNIKYPISWAEGCVEFNNSVIDWLRENPSVEYVVLASPFRGYFSPQNNLLVNGKLIRADYDIAVSQFKKTLFTLSEMGVTPVIFAPIPSYGENIFNCLVSNILSFRQIDCRIRVSDYHEYQKEVIKFLKDIEKDYPVMWVSQMLCDDDFCNTELDGVFLYRDSGHFSNDGSAYVGAKMDFYQLITSQ